MKLTSQKLESWGCGKNGMVIFHHPNFNRFCKIHPCDGRTGDSMIRAIAYNAVARKNDLLIENRRRNEKKTKAA